MQHGNVLTSRKRPMNRLSSSTYSRESSTHERAIEALARQSHVPIDQVAQLYAHELAVLEVSALTIAGAYIAGGCIPLGPYILLATASAALSASVAITLLALAMFGYVKGHFTGAPRWRSAMQTVLIGGVAAGAAFMIARAIS